MLPTLVHAKPSSWEVQLATLYVWGRWVYVRCSWNVYVQCKTLGVMPCKYFSPLDITVNVTGIASHMSVGKLVSSKRFLVACGNVKILTAWDLVTQWEHFYGNLVSGNNKTYLGLNVKCMMFWPDINQVCIFSTILSWMRWNLKFGKLFYLN